MSLMEKLRSRDPIPEDKLVWLGTHGGLAYAKRGDKEYAITGFPVTDDSYSLKPNEVFIRRHRDIVLDDGERMPTAGLHVGMPVESGTWQRLARKQAKQPTGPRVWDALAAFRRTTSDVRRLPLRQSANPDLGALKAELGVDEPMGAWLELRAQGLSDTSPAGLVNYLRRRGITLELGRGRVIARSAKPINVTDRQLLELAEPLIVGELGGPVASCALCDQPAVTLAVPRAPLCAEHAQ